MNKSEASAKEYLVYRGFKTEDVVFEPDGNITPDFLVEDRIAVEVRRLNQHWRAASGDLEPVERLSVPFFDRLRKLLDAFGPPTNGVSWCVIHSFMRPQLTKDWEPILRDSLQPFHKGLIHDREKIILIDRHLKVCLFRLSKPGATTFIWGGGSDFDRGGWVVAELEKNLAICIVEKSRKITANRIKYPEWWLILVDHIMGGTPERMHIEHDLDKVLIIHPSNYGLAYEIPGSNLQSIPDKAAMFGFRRG